MRKTVLCLAVMSLLALGGPALAELCTIDAVPASTLLVHNFRVELDSDTGLTTLFSVNNASAAPVLTHVTFWTDWSIATIDFDLYLTGFDVQTFNVRDVFNGLLPQTDNNPNVSNQGAFSLPNVDFPGCGGLPIGNLPQTHINLLRTAHTGVAVNFPGVPGNQCWGEAYGDNVARGYITIDVVQACSVLFPNSPGYFASIAGFDNVIWGDVFWVDPDNNFAQGVTAVHLESGPAPGGVCSFFVPGDYTFYGRYVAFNGSDCREPMGTTYATRYLTGAAFSGGTSLVCWRDTKTNPLPRTCGTGRPSPMGLTQRQVVVFDEEENPSIVVAPPISPVPEEDPNTICPIETQVTPIGGADFPVAFDNGWLYLNLNHDVPAGPIGIAQAYVTTVMDAEGRYSVGFDAIQLDSACDSTCFTLGPGGVITSCAVAQ